jgi:hypothetical protein
MGGSLQIPLEGEERMTGTWRPLTLAAALIVTMAAAATAQTVIVAKTPPGTAVELGVNATAILTATSDANGVATLPLDTLAPLRSKTGGKTEMDVRVFVDVCEKARRVWLTETGWQPPAIAAGCTRRELFGVFALQKTTSLVVDAAEQNQAVWIRQGAAPSSWLDPNARPDTGGGPIFPIPTGIILFGGPGIGKFATSGLVACGSEENCTASVYTLTFRAGAEFWLNRHMAVTGSYIKPIEMKATGAGTGYRFTTTLSPNIATIGGKGGLPFGRSRIYGEGGAVYQRSNLQTTQSVNPITVTVSEEEVIFPGGTQEFNLQTAGWSWYFGGGVEIWINRKLGVYVEGGRAGLRGSPIAGGEGSLNDTLTYLIGGIRFRLSR